jgi:hypothetical protein
VFSARASLSHPCPAFIHIAQIYTRYWIIHLRQGISRWFKRLTANARDYPKTNPHNLATIPVKARFHPEISAVNERAGYPEGFSPSPN